MTENRNFLQSFRRALKRRDGCEDLELNQTGHFKKVKQLRGSGLSQFSEYFSFKTSQRSADLSWFSLTSSNEKLSSFYYKEEPFGFLIITEIWRSQSSPPTPRLVPSSSSGFQGSVAVVVRFEGPLCGQAQVLGLFVRQLGELHPQLVQVSSCHLLIQLWRQNKKLVTQKPSCPRRLCLTKSSG